MTRSKYPIFDVLNSFLEIVQEGPIGLVDGKHFFETIADDAFFDFRYNFSGWPLTIRGRGNLMDQFSGYGNTIKLHSADGLVVAPLSGWSRRDPRIRRARQDSS